MGQVLVLVPSFPALTLLLVALTAVEKRLPGGPPGAKPRDSACQPDDRVPAERRALVLWPGGRGRRRATPRGEEVVRAGGGDNEQYRETG